MVHNVSHKIRRNVRKFSGHPYMGRIGHICDSSAFVLLIIIFLQIYP